MVVLLLFCEEKKKNNSASISSVHYPLFPEGWDVALRKKNNGCRACRMIWAPSTGQGKLDMVALRRWKEKGQ